MLTASLIALATIITPLGAGQGEFRPFAPEEVAPIPVEPSREPVEEPVVEEGESAEPAEDAAAELEDVGEAEDDPEELVSDDPEAEDESATGEASGHLYSGDLSDEELARLWREDPKALGSISLGFAHAGRMINAEPFPEGEHWTVVSPPHAWALRETIDAIVTAITTVAEEHPGSPKLRVNHISGREGGYLRPHRSHQTGRDVDLAFYYLRDVPPGYRGKREHLIDPARNWALVKALVTLTDVQVILVDRRIQKVIYDHALSIGEDPEWVRSIFGIGGGKLVQHARRHYDHFHVRLFAPRAQELGLRLQPLLPERPEANLYAHRIRPGDNLSTLARRYGTTVAAIQRANRMRGTFLSVGRTLMIPLRKPCTRCPVPPQVVVPPRNLPPTLQVVETTAAEVPDDEES